MSHPKMSLLPFYYDLTDPRIERWHNFGLGLHPKQLHVPHVPHTIAIQQAGYHHWPHLFTNTGRADIELSKFDEDGFQVCLDVQQFAPNEITVKTIDNCIFVEAQHEERQDEHGYISRQFTRRYALPDGFNAYHVESELSSDGILTIKAPPPAKSDSNVRIVPIKPTGPAKLIAGKKEAIKKADADQEKKP